MHRLLRSRLTHLRVNNLLLQISRSSGGSRPQCDSKEVHCGREDGNEICDATSNTRRKTTGSDPVPNTDFSWLDKLVYSSYLEQFLPPMNFRARLEKRFEAKESLKEELISKTAILPPVSIKYLLEDSPQGEDGHEESICEEGQTLESKEESAIQFPYKILRKTKFLDDEEEQLSSTLESIDGRDKSFESAAERLKTFSSFSAEQVLHDDQREVDPFESVIEDCLADAGTPNPAVAPSNVPCGGCGALLHCQDQSIPGYISSETFTGAKKMDLMEAVCYRCSILDAHKATLNVNVSPEEYPRIVSKIREKFAMILLMVDLTDFPCSIWPGILDIIGNRRPVILVGNKVDMLPQDSDDYLERVEKNLIKCAVDVGMLDANVVHTALISAKTGYGVEDLISTIFNMVKGKGDLFIMGCTNVGKSSLFNLLLQSDLCNPRASDFVQRATVSQWPGTTLNLLKFPMADLYGWRRALRYRRLQAERPALKAEEEERQLNLRETRDEEHAIITGHVGKTFLTTQKLNEMEAATTVKDIFRVNISRNPPRIRTSGQWDPEHSDYARGHWVYDTPGAVNENQILDLLTLPELMQSLPKTLIRPRTFYIKPGMSFFVGGLARLDFLEGESGIRYTLFTNPSLPVTMTKIDDADEVYEKSLGSKVLGAPCGDMSRIAQFPPLIGKMIEFNGRSNTRSCMDIVLSSIGWIAVTASSRHQCKLYVHTPNGKGIFFRRPALLPYAVNWKGKRIRGTYAYLPHKLFVSSPNTRRRTKLNRENYNE